MPCSRCGHRSAKVTFAVASARVELKLTLMRNGLPLHESDALMLVSSDQVRPHMEKSVEGRVPTGVDLNWRT